MFHFEYTHKFDCVCCNHALVQADSIEEAAEKLRAHLGHLEEFEITYSTEVQGEVILISSD
jgi:hypothetical protein